MPHLCTRIKYKCITIYIKNRTGEGTLHLKYVPKEYTKQTKTNEEEWHKGKKLFKLYNPGFYPSTFLQPVNGSKNSISSSFFKYFFFLNVCLGKP